MKKPLSYKTYFVGNKRSVLRYIAILIITVSILSIAKIIISNVSDELNQYIKSDKYFIKISTNDGTLLDKEVVNKLKNLNEVESVMPTKSIHEEFRAFASAPDYEIYFLSKEDIKKVLDASKVKSEFEDINNLNENQVLIADRIRKNKNLSKGDRVVTGSDLKYQSSINTDLLFGFTPKELKFGSNEYILIPKAGQMNEMVKKIKNILPASCKFGGENSVVRELANKNTQDTFDIVKMIITIACAITTGVSSYLHYFNRKGEIGILKALGYSDKKIIVRISKEIIISTAIALVISLILMNCTVNLLNIFLADPNGYLRFVFNISMLSEMFMVVLSIMLFSLIPTWVLLKSVDKIALIEGGL